ncbi:hypothetical protein [Streptosporangium amethystogenes]|uniref:hypothetical protein n=1 Tax=Streptosporangium amethystogenes TaxID=2002 RepID=UPI0012F88C53|nr:hypothetical protein [Streptosporangium amethystogenes]
MRATSGRHRAGAPIVRVRPGRWDDAQRAAAAQLDRLEPAWTVMYGVGSRRFIEMAEWNAPHAIRVEAANVDELRRRMRESELEQLSG